MFNNNFLNISAIKNANSLKLDYRKLKNDQIVEFNQWVFFSGNEVLPRDAAHKINNLQNKNYNIYISTLLISDDTKLIKKDSLKKLKDYSITSLNDEYNIAVLKNSLFETSHYFEATNIDFIYSHFHILNSFIDKKPSKNSLLVMFSNDKGYIIVVNNKGSIVFSKSVTFTSFSNVKNSKFYKSDVMGQKLFDELHFFEVLEMLNNTINEFYENTKDVFIEEIRFLYTIKQLNKEQIAQIKEQLMLEVFYNPISIEEELFELVKNKEQQIKSFIIPREKKKDNKGKIVLTILSIIIIFLIGYLTIPIEQLINNNNIKNEQQQMEKIELPNHIEKNLAIKKRVKDVFDAIPFDVVLNKLQVTQDSSIIDANFLSNDIYIKTIQPQLLTFYGKSDIKFLEDKKSVVYNGIIKNTQIITPVKSSLKMYEKGYIADEFIPIIKVTEQLKKMFPENTTINFKSTSKLDFTTFNYLISLVTPSPELFFDIIEELNNEPYSINLSYPINFVKIPKEGVKITFMLQFHQPN